MNWYKQTAVFFLAGFFLFGFANMLDAQTVVRGPYLQTPTQNSIIIKWRTSSATNSRVNYGTSMGSLTLTQDDNASTTEHTVKLTGLSAFSTYYYSVGSTSQTLSGPDSLHHFKTSPVPGTVQPVRIWAIGDFGKANTGEQNTRDAYLNYTAGTHTDVWLWLGDNAYDNGTDQQFQDKVFDYNYYGNVMKFIPFMPCPGNHDYESICAIPCFTDPNTHSGPYLDIVDVPKNGEAGGVASGKELYYSFDYANVHFISLNSELGSLLGSFDWNGVYSASNFTNSPVRQWLISDLTANTKPWVIVYFHQLPYSKGSHDSDAVFEIYMKAMRENYVPIFDQFKVDIVLCGHSHVYERSMMIKGHTGTSGTFNPSLMLVDGSSGYDSLGEAYVKDLTIPSGTDGTVYVVVGCSGSLETGAALNHPVMFFGYADNHGSLVMDVNDNRLDSRFITAQGNVLDHFTMLKVDAATHVIEYSAVNDFKIYPNPFSGQTHVNYQLTKKSKVSLKILDVQGKELYILFEGIQNPGHYDVPVDAELAKLNQGAYIVKLTDGVKEFFKKAVKLD